MIITVERSSWCTLILVESYYPTQFRIGSSYDFALQCFRPVSGYHLNRLTVADFFYVSSAISNMKSSAAKDFTAILSFVNAFSKPLSDLVKRTKAVESGQVVVMTIEELAFCTLCETIVSAIPESTSLVELPLHA